MARSKNEIRRVQDLPEWFRLENYHAAGNLDAAGWYEQLVVRRDCFTMMDFTSGERRGNSKPLELGQYFVDALTAIRKKPIVDVLSTPQLAAYFYGGMLCDLKNAGMPRYSCGVHAMTVRELRMAEQSMSKGRREYSRRWWEQILMPFDFSESSDNGEKYSHKSWMDKPIYESGELLESQYSEEPNRLLRKTIHVRKRDSRTPVMVNLNLPDAVLVESFGQWLAMEREKTRATKILKQYRKPDFDSWMRMGVLPWLDLTIWAMEFGVNIPNRVMADAIFPYGEGGEETVRKTTKPIALNLTENGYYRVTSLDVLGAQAALEKAVLEGKAEEKNMQTFPE